MIKEYLKSKVQALCKGNVFWQLWSISVILIVLGFFITELMVLGMLLLTALMIGALVYWDWIEFRKENKENKK